jgi:hypothetical protein
MKQGEKERNNEIKKEITKEGKEKRNVKLELVLISHIIQ